MDYLTWETANNIEKTLKIALDNAPGSGSSSVTDRQTAKLGKSVLGVMVLGKSGSGSGSSSVTSPQNATLGKSVLGVMILGES
jgi:hypothetical protein